MTTVDNAKGVWHKWMPLAPPVAFDCDFARLDALRSRWSGARADMERLALDALDAFEARWGRFWAIETGVIEGAYDISAAESGALVDAGFDANLIATDDADKIVEVLNDHLSALTTATLWAREDRPFGKWAVRALHGILMAHQKTALARNQFGDLFEATLLVGEFKRRPNNPTRRDGLLHEYCPPEQVESEMESLFAICEERAGRDHPMALAAWAHHAFAKTHPFQDGNGRVGRAMLAWQLARDGMPPLVVSRVDRTGYIDALESADAGDLTPLAALFAELECVALSQAIAASEAALGDG